MKIANIFLIAVLNNESTPMKVNNANITVATATTIVEDCKSAHFCAILLYI